MLSLYTTMISYSIVIVIVIVIIIVIVIVIARYSVAKSGDNVCFADVYSMHQLLKYSECLNEYPIDLCMPMESIAMENGQVEDVFPCEHENFPLPCC